MRRLLLLPIVILSLALVLTACGDDGDTNDMNDMNGGMGSDAGDMSGDMSGDVGGDVGGSGDMGDMGHGGEANTPMVDGAREIEVTATSFAFDPDEITVAAGEDVTIVLTADDILHDFTLENAEGHIAADAGETASGGLRIDEPGTYIFYCSVEGHREAGMEGTLIVE